MNVTFEETSVSVMHDHSTPHGLAGFLIKYHLVKTLSQAQIVLLVLALIIFVASGFLAHASMKSDTIDTKRNFVPAVPIR